MNESHPLEALAEYLKTNQHQIIDRWRDSCEADDTMEVVSRLTFKEFRDNIPSAIDGLCSFIRGATEATAGKINSNVAKHGHHRWKQGFSLRQLIRDWGHLNRVLVSTFEEFFEECPSQDSNGRRVALDRLALFITNASSGSVRRFDELRESKAAALATDLKLVNEKFERLTAARGQLLREAAHDIRGGLTAIKGASDVLKLSERPNESFEELLDALDHGIESVKDTLNSLLDLSRLESGAEQVELMSVDIAEVLDQLALEHVPTAESKGLTLKADGPRDFCVSTDPQKVRRIAQNLLLNALEHTKQGSVQLSWSSGRERWVLKVSDTGPGIQEVAGSPIAQELDHPNAVRAGSDVDEYCTYHGEGIGLAIVKRLCDMLDAGVTLDSKLGKGTTFTIEFPLEYKNSHRDSRDHR